MRKFFHENGLSIAMFGLFFVALVGQSIAGYYHYNDEETDHGHPSVGYLAYLGSGHFIEATFENWEGEFLPMTLMVLLTACLRQKGSASSKKVDGKDEVDRVRRSRPGAPWPVREGGIVLLIYENSLSLALTLLFLGSAAMHAVGGARSYNHEQELHGGTKRVTAAGYVATSEFWFESFQNWQSEFLSIGTLCVLSIYLRQKGSPESKPVAAPNDAEE